MKTKKLYTEPEMRTIVMLMPTALLAGSGADAGVSPSGTNWGEEIED